MFKIVTLLWLKCQHSVLHEQYLPMLFNIVPMWPKSYHTTGPKSTLLRHLVRHRTLSKTLPILCQLFCQQKGRLLNMVADKLNLAFPNCFLVAALCFHIKHQLNILNFYIFN